MTNLEFIETLIEEGKEEIELAKKIIAEDDKYHSIKKNNEENLKSMEEILTHLQQIKTELEAWEVVKPNICKREIEEKRFIIQVVGGVYYEGECWTSGVNPYEVVKKALEVENAKN